LVAPWQSGATGETVRGLLPHPDGLEGLLAIEVNIHVHHLPVAELDHLRLLELHARAAG
jgi:hypothetical protein